MLPEKLYECLKHEGIVAIATASRDGKAHVVNTWNSYITVLPDNRILFPAAGMFKTEANVKENPYLEISIGSHEVMGRSRMGTGFLLTGKLEFQKEGSLYDMIKAEYPFTHRVAIFTPDSCRQML